MVVSVKYHTDIIRTIIIINYYFSNFRYNYVKNLYYLFTINSVGTFDTEFILNSHHRSYPINHYKSVYRALRQKFKLFARNKKQ